MKKFLPFLVAAFLAPGCSWLDPSLPGIPRGGRITLADPIAGKRDTSTVSQAADTSVWVCGVQVTPGYDWVRDTAMGAMDARLVLYKDTTRILCLPISDATYLKSFPGTHHLAGGHLYTEYTSGNKTVICKDGEPLLTINGTELLKGLLPVGDDLLTLGFNPEGGITYRKNGEIGLVVEKASIFGGLGESAPALYMDEGKARFAFMENGALFSVSNGVVKSESLPGKGTSVIDFRYIGGVPCCTYIVFSFSPMVYGKYGDGVGFPLSLGYSSQGCYAEPNGSEALFWGVFPKSGDGQIQTVWMPSKKTDCIAGHADYAFMTEGNCRGIAAGPPLEIFGPPGTSYRGEDELIFTRECCTAAGGSLYAAASSRIAKPRVIKNGKVRFTYPFDGYLTAIYVEISPPN